MKGIILAAGAGTRLYPATFPVSKILLPVYDRPMIYYPLSTMISAGINDILVITNEKDLDNFKRTLGDGSNFGIKIEYTIQYVQRGISDAFIISENWINGERVSLILGDNIFYGEKIDKIITDASKIDSGAVIFGYNVPDPERFGVIEFDGKMKVLSLEEKPLCPKSNYIAVGLYFYDGHASEFAKTLRPSSRGELEITDLNIKYLEENRLSVKIFDEDIRWIDAGTFESLLTASSFIHEEEKRLGKKIMCPELIALRRGLITEEKLIAICDSNKNSEYYKDIKKEIELSHS